jgi:chemotaxis protein methyltransferase CheR
MEVSLFKKFCEITYEKSGIALKPGKEALVEARVAKRQRALHIESQQEYLQYLETEPTGEELVFFLDAISTNYTHFFREKGHFDILEQDVRAWEAAGCRQLKIWCAASSTGEEPYSLVVTMMEALEGTGADFKLLATDISTRVLEKASAGIYSAEQLEPVGRPLRAKYFNRIGKRDAEDEVFKIKEVPRQHVVFKRLNLSQPPFPMSGPLDAVFCRNVMIYFDQAVRQGLISEIERLLKPGGLLCIGHSETLTGIKCGLKLERPSVYRKLHHGPTLKNSRNVT